MFNIVNKHKCRPAKLAPHLPRIPDVFVFLQFFACLELRTFGLPPPEATFLGPRLASRLLVHEHPLQYKSGSGFASDASNAFSYPDFRTAPQQ